MAKHNFGVIKATFTTYMNESENLHAKEMFGNFMKLIKESKFLRNEFEIYKNLENKHIPNENLAIKYIDENINLISGKFTIADYNNAQSSLEKLVEGLTIKVSSSKKEFYDHIDSMIHESLAPTPDVDKLHESFSFVLEFVKNNKPKLIEASVVENGIGSIPKEFLIKKAIEKFNEKYASLNESDKSLFKSIVSTKIDEKQTVFSSLKEETLTSLKSLIGRDTNIDSKVNESITKITNMSFNGDTYTKDILSLNELKISITQ